MKKKKSDEKKATTAKKTAAKETPATPRTPETAAKPVTKAVSKETPKKATTTPTPAPGKVAPTQDAPKPVTPKHPANVGTQPTAAKTTEPKAKTVEPTTPATPVAATETVRSTISAEERHAMIQEAAYFRALERGSESQEPHGDWAAAEAAIDAMLAEHATETP